MPNTDQSEYDFLCERCGYLLNEISDASVCPECGESIKNSDLHNRPGSPWQQRPSFRTFLTTNVQSFVRPSTSFRHAAIETSRSRLLLAVNLLIAGTLLASPWTGTFVGDPARGLLHSGLAHDVLFGLWTVAQSIAAALLLGLLTYVEYQGIRFFGARRGWRITRAVALQICAHASVGWIVTAILPLFVLAGFFSAQVFASAVPQGTVNLGPRFGQVSLSEVVPGAAYTVALFVGLLVFESLVYVGVRQCRFANRPRPTESGPSIGA